MPVVPGLNAGRNRFRLGQEGFDSPPGLLSDPLPLKPKGYLVMCTCQFKRKPAHRFYLSVFFYLIALPLIVCAATQSKKVPTVAKWGRYEQSFKSSVNYSNALQDATLTGVFISPLG